MKCYYCARTATHLNPMNLCDFHYVENYSVQPYKGELLPFKIVLKRQLEKNGMWKKDDETLDEWYNRCKAYVQERVKKIGK